VQLLVAVCPRVIIFWRGVLLRIVSCCWDARWPRTDIVAFSATFVPLSPALPAPWHCHCVAVLAISVAARLFGFTGWVPYFFSLHTADDFFPVLRMPPPSAPPFISSPLRILLPSEYLCGHAHAFPTVTAPCRYAVQLGALLCCLTLAHC